ncbi:glycosyltransferase [Saccharomonospora marina XMU15]|uniref:Glycosyltransferase n=1 Tax=Saccharomonospora marina XMU15 TaxID=882083 RepID=H5WYS5_9PSEU|nr:glycosyltransferase family 4 protein [Saccharomonospora marina]EHR51797.1 glycosyltransferase [Saccharomonospora marina XMU15]
MRILLLTQYFPPEIGAPQARLSEFARTWAADGDTVTVLTGMPNHPTGVVPPEYRGRLRAREQHDGYSVVRTWLYATPNEGFLRKTLCHLSFMVSSVLLGARASGRADVVMVSSPTFFAIGSAWVLAKLKRARLVVEVRDLWPAIFVELGVLTNRWIIKSLQRLELAAYHAADAVVVVTEGFRRNLVERGVPPAKVHTIRNGVDTDRFGGDTAANPAIRQRLGAGPGECLVVYAGALGISHALEKVVDAAALLTDQQVRFALVGEGAQKRRITERVRDLGLCNVRVPGGVARDEVPQVLAAADICVVSLRDVPLFSTFIPSKIFEYLAAEKAVVGAVRGEPAEILRAAGAVVVPPEDSRRLAEEIATLARDPARRADMGKEGRRFVEQNFDRAELARRCRTVFDSLGGPVETPHHRR